MNRSQFSMHWHSIEADERITVIELSGAMDISVADELSKGFERLLSDNRVFLLVDMECVDFVSSPVVGILMGIRRRLIERRGNLVLVGLSPEIREKLNLMGANRIFRYYDDVKAVINDYHWEYDHLAQVIALEVPANPAYVPALRRLVSSIALQKGYHRKDAFRIETIVDELTNNAIEHGDASQTKFYIEMSLDRDKVDISVRNSTQTLDDQSATRIREKFDDPQVDDASIRGRGLALVKMLSNDLRLDIDHEGTTVHVTKVREG